MATDPNPSLPPNSLSEPIPTEIDQALASGLGNFTLRELLSLMLTTLGHAERQAYGLLASSRSLNAAKAALRRIGLSGSEEDIQAVATDFIEELELRNTRPLDPDRLALFVDAKYVEVKDGDRLRPGCTYLAVGLGRDGKKRVLASTIRPGRENLEDWKGVLRGLIERGLRRVLILVHDDFSGLLPITQSLFPQADVQLCIVPVQRNAKNHLGKAAASEFTKRLRALKTAWNDEVAAQFEATRNPAPEQRWLFSIRRDSQAQTGHRRHAARNWALAQTGICRAECLGPAQRHFRVSIREGNVTDLGHKKIDKCRSPDLSGLSATSNRPRC